MKGSTIDNDLLVRYLLGRLSEQEHERIDQRYLGNRDFVEQLLAAEDDLIDSYVRGELSPSDKGRFEELFLPIPDRRRRVDFARLWVSAVSDASAARRRTRGELRRSWRERLAFNSPWALVPITACLLLAALSLWLVLQVTRVNRELNSIRSELASTKQSQQEVEHLLAEARKQSDLGQPAPTDSGESKAEPNKPLAQTMKSTIAVVLAPGLTRSRGETQRLAIPSGVRTVELRADVPADEYRSYTARLETVDGKVVWRRSGLKARRAGQGKMVVLFVPSGTFSSDDYVLTLLGVKASGESESVSDYFLRVVKE